MCPAPHTPSQPVPADTEPALYPLTFTPVFKDYPWGGRNLETIFQRTIPEGIVAESWDIAAHPNGSSPVSNGAFAGMTLPQLMDELGEELVGSNSEQATAMGRFPLLIKLLDANRWLSIQVHPEDGYALANENEFGKTEMWVVLHAEPGAELIFGFKPGVTREQFERAIGTDACADLCHRVAVKAGDVIFVQAGSIHALGPGIVVAEIQQNSDTTYRIYDWGRPRPIHIRQALDVLNFKQVAPSPARPKVLMAEAGLKIEQLASCPYFETERITLPKTSEFYGVCDGTTFEIYAVLQGKASIEGDFDPVTLTAVSWALLPAALGEFQIVAEEDSIVLRVIVP